MIIKQLELGPMANFVYLVGDPKTMSCAVIDPGWGAGDIMEEAKRAGLNITHILLTHTHFDHSSAAKTLAKKTGARLFIHRLECKAEGGETPFADGDTINVGELVIKCLHTPGHTPGSSCFLAGDTAFTGDTLFIDGIGRTDLEGSDPEDMFRSLKRLSELPPATVIYPGHNYGGEPVSTIGEQKRRNPYLQCRNTGEFLGM
jgi:glyoxylase-like metal-dependent hydrolase (beta-lactamase superfamily II)